MINMWLINHWSIIDIENFKRLIYESVSDTSEKNIADIAEIAETAEASTSSVLMLEEVKQKKKNFLKFCVRRIT